MKHFEFFLCKTIIGSNSITIFWQQALTWHFWSWRSHKKSSRCTESTSACLRQPPADKDRQWLDKDTSPTRSALAEVGTSHDSSQLQRLECCRTLAGIRTASRRCACCEVTSWRSWYRRGGWEDLARKLEATGIPAASAALYSSKPKCASRRVSSTCRSQYDSLRTCAAALVGSAWWRLWLGTRSRSRHQRQCQRLWKNWRFKNFCGSFRKIHVFLKIFENLSGSSQNKK